MLFGTYIHCVSHLYAIPSCNIFLFFFSAISFFFPFCLSCCCCSHALCAIRTAQRERGESDDTKVRLYGLEWHENTLRTYQWLLSIFQFHGTRFSFFFFCCCCCVDSNSCLPLLRSLPVNLIYHITYAIPIYLFFIFIFRHFTEMENKLILREAC